MERTDHTIIQEIGVSVCVDMLKLATAACGKMTARRLRMVRPRQDFPIGVHLIARRG